MTTTPTTRTDGVLSYPAARATGCPLDPAPALADLQRHGRLTRVRLSDGQTPWLVTRYDDQRTLLADSRMSSEAGRPGYPSPAATQEAAQQEAGQDGDGQQGSKISFILMDDPEHARLRRMVTAPFMVKRVRAMRPRIQQLVDELIDRMLAGPRPVDLVQAFALPLPSLVICELLGVPYDDHDFFQENSRTIVTISDDRTAGRTAMGNLTRYLSDLLTTKMEQPGDDLLSGLVERIRAGELTVDEAAQMGMLLLLAGHETTANMIALGTLALLQHPDQLALLRDSGDPQIAISATEELLRYLHITHNGRRRVATADIEFAGEIIRAGDGVIFPGEIGNRDPEAFERPDDLDLTRDARRHVAFGFGVHQCLGQPLARAELQIVYSTLYRRIPGLALAADPATLDFKHDAAVYGVRALPVTW
ncbi:cytochrome P450 [Microlunatus soli]|uniref:Cytochrome P450 n=1 Tax=Microlunatus soli TaxID=630515 RepID=A0A1H1XRR6_9ACTN|nr:cytochrome P450 [Microlunatus soli]SDT11873.1 hypothetical protein SAMN04489812_4210 [Microlunatus soli]